MVNDFAEFIKFKKAEESISPVVEKPIISNASNEFANFIDFKKDKIAPTYRKDPEFRALPSFKEQVTGAIQHPIKTTIGGIKKTFAPQIDLEEETAKYSMARAGATPEEIKQTVEPKHRQETFMEVLPFLIPAAAPMTSIKTVSSVASRVIPRVILATPKIISETAKYKSAVPLTKGILEYVAFPEALNMVFSEFGPPTYKALAKDLSKTNKSMTVDEFLDVWKTGKSTLPETATKLPAKAKVNLVKEAAKLSKSGKGNEVFLKEIIKTYADKPWVTKIKKVFGIAPDESMDSILETYGKQIKIKEPLPVIPKQIPETIPQVESPIIAPKAQPATDLAPIKAIQQQSSQLATIKSVPVKSISDNLLPVVRERVKIDTDKIKNIEAAILKGEKLPPIPVYEENGKLILNKDGFHRLQANINTGQDNMLVKLEEKTGLAAPAKQKIERQLAEITPTKISNQGERLLKQPYISPEIKDLKQKEVKGQIRKITGQVKIGALVKETTALKEVFKAQQKASKIGFKEGKTVGAEKVKENVARVKEAKLQRDQLKAHVNKLISDIQKSDINSLPLEYKKQIREIQNQYDLNKRQKKTLFRRNSLKKFIERETDLGNTVNISKEQLDLVYKKPLNNMTIDELEDAHSVIMKLHHIGKTKDKMLSFKKERDFNVIINNLTNTVTHGETIQDVGRIIGLEEKNNFEQFLEKAKIAREALIRPDRMFLSLDGFDDFGFNYQYIYKPINYAYTNELIGRNKQIEAIEKMASESKINILEEIKNKTKVKGLPYKITGEQKIAVYINSLNPQNKYHLYGNGFTDKQIESIINSLSENQKLFADKIMSFYNTPNRYNEINDVYKVLIGEDMPKVEENYFPIYTDSSETSNATEPERIVEELMARRYIDRAIIERGFTKERSPKDLTPLSLKFFSNLLRDINRTEHFKAFGLATRDVRKIIENPLYKKAVKQVEGNAVYNNIDTWLKDVVDPARNIERGIIANLLKYSRRRMALVYLGFNFLTSLKQTLSSFTAASQIPFSFVIKGWKETVLHPKEIEKFVYSRSPQLKYRSVERDLREMIESKTPGEKLVKKVKLDQVAMGLISYLDKKTVLSVWKGAYDWAIKTNPEERAIEFADLVVRKTQPAAAVKDLPPAFRGGEISKTLTMFQNMISQNYNLIVSDIGGKRKAGKISNLEAMRRFLWVVLVPAIFMGAISKGRIQKNAEEIGADIGGYLTSTIPGFSMIFSDYGVTVPSFRPLEVSQNIYRNIKKGKFEKAILPLAELAAIIKGVPFSQPKRTLQGVGDLLSGETNDFRRFIYSKYQLDKGKEKKKKRYIPKL